MSNEFANMTTEELLNQRASCLHFFGEEQFERRKLRWLEEAYQVQKELCYREMHGPRSQPVETGPTIPPETKTADLAFSTRINNFFKINGIETVADILALGTSGLMRLDNIGKQSVREVMETLWAGGVRLQKAPLPPVSLIWPPDDVVMSGTLDGKPITFTVGEYRAYLAQLPEGTEIEINWTEGDGLDT